MKPSYSTRWLLCWILFVLALLTLIAGVFVFPTDWRQGLGLTLIGIGLAGPSAWWLRHASRKTRVRRMKIVTCLGVVLMLGGAFLIVWQDLGKERSDEADGIQETTTESTIEGSPAPASTDSSTAAPSVQATEPESLTSKPTPSEVDPEPTVTVTEVETQVPSEVTVYSEVPVVPTPPQNSNPDTGGNGAQTRPPERAPGEPTTQTEGTYPAPIETENPQLQEQTTEEQQIPDDQGASRNGAGYLGQNFPQLGGGEPMEPSRLFNGL